MKMKHNTYSILYISLLVLLFSCKTLEGPYSLKRHCGYSSINFISKTEFIHYRNLGYDFKSNWDYGKYYRKKKEVELIYEEIPTRLKYISKNAFFINKKDTAEDSIKVKIQAFTFDSIKIRDFQAMLINSDHKIITGNDSYNGNQIVLTVDKSVLPCAFNANIMGGNKIDFQIDEPKNHYINLYFDNFPTPKYNMCIGANLSMTMGKDNIGKYIISKEGDGRDDYKFYKN